MKSTQLPRTVTVHGRTLVSAGDSRSPQGVLYFDPSQQRLQEFFIATVKTAGELYAVASVEGNAQLNRVRVDLSTLSGGLKPGVGDALLIGDLHQRETGMSAGLALMLVPAAKAAPKPAQASVMGRSTGTIIFTRGKWAKISTDSDGSEIFAHATQWRPSAEMQIGQRCSFVLGKNDRGPCAYDIRIAA